MENDKIKLLQIIIIPLTIVAVMLIMSRPHDIIVPQIENCKQDSLQTVIYQLQTELQMDEDGWDKKEQRYEDALFQYEYGLNHLKQSHPNAYREFHRIIGFKEKYNRETERENKKRLELF